MESQRRHSVSYCDTFPRMAFHLSFCFYGPKKRYGWISVATMTIIGYVLVWVSFVCLFVCFSGKLEISSAFLSDKYCKEKQMGESGGSLHPTPPRHSHVTATSQPITEGQEPRAGTRRTEPWRTDAFGPLPGLLGSHSARFLIQPRAFYWQRLRAWWAGPFFILKTVKTTLPTDKLTKMVIHLRGFLSASDLPPAEACC